MAFRISNLPTVMLDESRGNIFSRAIVISTILQTLKNIGVVPRGEGGIRTPDTPKRIPVFKTGRFNHSRTSPCKYFPNPRFRCQKTTTFLSNLLRKSLLSATLGSRFFSLSLFNERSIYVIYPLLLLCNRPKGKYKVLRMKVGSLGCGKLQ